MPRKPRYFLPGVPMHIVQRGHSKAPVFFENADYRAYLNWLKEGAERYSCAIHAYVLMTNHIHLLVTPTHEADVSRLIQYIGRHYVPYINDQYGSSGSLWEGRYKANLVQEEHYLLSCMRYIELNPLRAGMVKSPGQYPWSSYRANALGHDDPLITAHKLYRALGRSEEKRLLAYKDLFKVQLSADQLNEIRATWQTGTPLGSDKFKETIEQKLETKVGYSKRGRPKRI